VFALWPGQAAVVVEGHHLRSNQYLLVRVYNEEEARKNWGDAVIKPASAEAAGPSPQPTRAPADLTVGKLLIIKGTDVSFYIPPTGVGVVPDEHGQYVRDALTLERLEFCILVDQNGKKRYERGPQVVFPEPTETFIVQGGQKKFRALELNEIQGLHIKVIAPYEEGGRSYKEGDEIFLTGKETAIYFPRGEHSLVRYDGRDKHFAVAVPAGEARYVMHRKTGEIRTVRGPAMLLPNPVDEVIVRRILTEKECATWYPGNEEALAYNRSLRQLAANTPTTRSGAISEGDYERSRGRGKGGQTAGAVTMEASSVSRDTLAMVGDVLERGSSYTSPRTLVFNTKYEGVPSVDVRVGYAVMVVDKEGNRRVEQGPKTLLLEYDETLERLQLSTGRPKGTDRRVCETVFLRVANNQIGDACEVETADHVKVQLVYSLRVSFTQEPQRWFDVDNYVQRLCDQARSLLKAAVKRSPVETLYARAAEIVKEVLLGKADEAGQRPGLFFSENGMHLTDVDLLEAAIEDERISGLLQQAQQETVQGSITLLRAERSLEVTRKQEALTQEEAVARAETARKRLELSVTEVASKLSLMLATVDAEIREHEEQRKASIAKNMTLDVDHEAALARQRSGAGVRQDIQRGEQAIQLETLRAEVDAVVRRFGAAQSGFSEALLALSNNEVLVKVADAMSVQSFVGGKTLTDVIDKVFAGTPLEGLMEKVKAKSGSRDGKAMTRS